MTASLLPPAPDAARTALATGSTGRSGQASSTASQRKIHDAAIEFEAVFLTQMLQHMFEGLEPDKTFGGGHGESIARTFQLNEMGRIMARGGGIGLAPQVERAMLRQQEVATA